MVGLDSDSQDGADWQGPVNCLDHDTRVSQTNHAASLLRSSRRVI